MYTWDPKWGTRGTNTFEPKCACDLTRLSRMKWVPEMVFVVNGQMNKDQESHKLECIVILKKGPFERIVTTISSQLKHQNKSTSTIETAFLG